MKKSSSFSIKHHLKVMFKNVLLMLALLTLPYISEAQLLKFVAYGDSRSDATIHSSICARMNTESLGLIIHSGDMYDYYTNGITQWLGHFQAQPNLNTLLNNNKILVSYGNHESASIVTSCTPSIVRNSSANYSFKEGNVFFVCAGLDPTTTAMLTFIENELKKPEATSADFRVLFFHYPVYSRGNYTYTGNAALEALCDQYNVTFTFSGHDHSYQRSKLMYGRVAVYSGTDVPAGTNGTTYIVTGGAGAPIYTARTATWTDNLSNSNHYCVLSSYSDRIEMVVKNSSGTVIETFIRRKASSINYTLTTSVVGQGSISLNPTGGTYSSGTNVTVTATPSIGYAFSGWSGDLTGSTNPSTITVSANKSITATFIADTQAPTPPTNLASSNVTSSSTTLNWTASTDNIGVTGYDVYMNGVLLASSTTTSYIVTGLTAATTYSFYVKAKDAAGNVSTQSNTINVTTSSITYCTSMGNNVSREWIDLVQLNTINNITAANAGYGNFTSLSTNLTKGTSYTIYFSAGFASTSYTEYWSIWIDWNQNGIFESTEVINSSSSKRNVTLSKNFTVPTSAMIGSTRMRVSMKYNAAPTACETFSYGEVEDYTINIQSTAALSKNNELKSSINEASTTISVYPNPANSTINIKINKGVICREVKIFNSIGTLVKIVRTDSNEITVDISELPAGVYIISGDDSKKSNFTRFVKK